MTSQLSKTTMKTITTFSLCILLASCASTRLMQVPVGSWDYSITGTPNGNYSGVLIITLVDGKYSGLLKSQEGEIALNDPSYDKASKKFTGNFSYQGTPISFESITTGDAMTGSLSAGGSNFPFKATKKK